MMRIGISTFTQSVDGRSFNACGIDYIGSVIKAGAMPVLIPLTDDRTLLEAYVDSVDGLLLSGGGDLNPVLFGEHNAGLSQTVSDQRDQQELFLLEKALEKGCPVLGICRGLQLINVYFGGTLYQDIPSQLDTALEHQNDNPPLDRYHHEVAVEENTKLYQIVKAKNVAVNSRHHQSVKDLGEGLIVSATSKDQIVEAIEHREKWIVGVQWHPENLTDVDPAHFQLLSAFVEEARRIKK